jgi:hypothetical protein
MRRVASPEVLGRSVGDDELEGERDPSEFEAGAHTKLLEDRPKMRVHRVSGNEQSLCYLLVRESLYDQLRHTLFGPCQARPSRPRADRRVNQPNLEVGRGSEFQHDPDRISAVEHFLATNEHVSTAAQGDLLKSQPAFRHYPLRTVSKELLVCVVHEPACGRVREHRSRAHEDDGSPDAALLAEELLQHQLLSYVRFVDETLLDHAGHTKSRQQHERMRIWSRTGQVDDAEYPAAFGIQNGRAGACETGEDIREVLGPFDEERLAFSDCRADAVRTDRLFGEDEAGGEFEAVERRGQGPVCLTAIEHLGMVVSDNHGHLHRAQVVYELVYHRS